MIEWAAMKILHALTYYHPHLSGLTIYVERLAETLAARGHEVTVATSRHLPALYGQIAAARALVGPLVVPGETACYMCWRMRAIASEEDFEAAMRFEELNDAIDKQGGRLDELLDVLGEVRGAVQIQGEQAVQGLVDREAQRVRLVGGHPVEPEGDGGVEGDRRHGNRESLGEEGPRRAVARAIEVVPACDQQDEDDC